MAQVNVRNRKKKDGSNSWEYRFETAMVDGKRKQVSKSGFNTKKEALEEGIKALSEYNRAGTHFKPSEMSVSDYFDYWIKNYCEVNLSDNSTAVYYSVINTHLKDKIGHYKLSSIDHETLQNCLNEICNDNDFSPKYVNTFRKVMNGAFKYAYATAKFINTNPAINLTIPKNVNSDNNKDIILTKEQVETILNRFKDKPEQYYPILIAYNTGLRVSEVYGLTWDRIDLENRTLTVDRIMKHFDYENRKDKVYRGIKGKMITRWLLGECKTKSSYRTIKFGKALHDALIELRKSQDENKAFYGEFYKHTYLKDELSRNNKPIKRIIQSEIPHELPEVEFVCRKIDGETMGPKSMIYPSKVINEELGIDFRFHALRHTHATMLIESGVPINIVSKRLGHSSARITWDIYVGASSELDEVAADVFDKTNAIMPILPTE